MSAKLRVEKYSSLSRLWLWACPVCKRFSTADSQPQALMLGLVHIGKAHRRAS